MPATTRSDAHAQIVSVEIPDPYGTPNDATARLKPGLRRDGTQAAGELEWHAPEAPRLVVVRSLRGDQIARMEARHQISQSQFAAGRHYQSLRLTLGSLDKGVRKNADGSVDIYIGPTAPSGQESNWLYTPQGKGWWPWFRLYGPEQALFDKTWKLPDIERVN